MILARFFSSILLCGLLLAGGCSTNPANLKRPETPMTLELPAAYKHETGRNRARFELPPGVYTAEYEDAEGTYFRGARACVQLWYAGPANKDQPADQLITREGGVYLPRKASEPAKIYVYVGSEVQVNPNRPSDGGPVVPASVATDIAARAAPAAGVGTGAVGAALGGAVVDALVAAEKGNLHFLTPVTGLREAVRTGAQ